ncbi:MAG: universal stress protein [Planctomycetes bacterium]|nr:universal stress protein [Planctomycetota bacterium]
MLRSLLVGITGSRWSEAALQIAMTWAGQIRIPITCLGVVDLRSESLETGLPLGVGQARPLFSSSRNLEPIREQIQLALKTASEMADNAGVECHVLNREGDPAALIGNEAQRHDLVILGRRPPVELNDRCPTPSETLTEILRHTPRPVIMACQSIPRSSDVVIAYDGSVQSARTLQSFVSSGLYFGHPLHLVGISDSRDSIQQSISRAVDFLSAHSLKAETQIVPMAGTVAETLTSFVHHVPAGLLVMGAYGKPWFKDLLFGSVTSTMLAEVPIPLFLNH